LAGTKHRLAGCICRERIVQGLPTILVVEDDHLIQSVVEEALKEGGFDIVIASSGEHAAELLDSNHGKYRALVTDVNLGRSRWR
jgi:DNA-binding response OmpR family regulator